MRKGAAVPLLGGKRAIVIGCGTFGAMAAAVLSRVGYKTTIIDLDDKSFDKLAADFDGETIEGDGTDCALLRKHGAKASTLMVCATSNDTTNMLSAEIGTQILGCTNVYARIKSEAIAEVLEEFDVEVICPQRAFAKELCLQAGLSSSKAGL